MPQPQKPDSRKATLTAKQPRRTRPGRNKATKTLIEAVEVCAESVSEKVDELVEKLAPYPLQDG